eukprot:3767631-Prymnesium_polylepis.1
MFLFCVFASWFYRDESLLACLASGLRGACYATSLGPCELRVLCVNASRLLGLWRVGVWARVLPYGRTGALPAGG